MKQIKQIFFGKSESNFNDKTYVWNIDTVILSSHIIETLFFNSFTFFSFNIF